MLIFSVFQNSLLSAKIIKFWKTFKICFTVFCSLCIRNSGQNFMDAGKFSKEKKLIFSIFQNTCIFGQNHKIWRKKNPQNSVSKHFAVDTYATVIKFLQMQLNSTKKMLIFSIFQNLVFLAKITKFSKTLQNSKFRYEVFCGLSKSNSCQNFIDIATVNSTKNKVDFQYFSKYLYFQPKHKILGKP